MEINYSKRKHESPFAEDPPKNDSPFPDNSLKLPPNFQTQSVRADEIRQPLKNAKLQYQPIDPRPILMPKNPIEVKYTRFQTWLLIGLSGFFGLAALLNLKQLLISSFTTTQDIIYKGVLFSGIILSLICAFIFLTIRAKRQAARSFDVFGIKRGDGRLFAWNEFRGVVNKTAVNRYGGKHIWRVELAFADGENAWLIPQRIKNYAEVFAFVDTLPRAVLSEATTANISNQNL